jgi:hypothetical protein
MGCFLTVERDYRRRNAAKVPWSAKNKFLDQFLGWAEKIPIFDLMMFFVSARVAGLTTFRKVERCISLKLRR